MKKQNTFVIAIPFQREKQSADNILRFLRLRLGMTMLLMFVLAGAAKQTYGQFTTDRDTLYIASGDSTTSWVITYDDTLAAYDLDGKILVGVDFDTTAAWTSVKFSIETSSTYNASADTAGGSPCDWDEITYEGAVYYFTPEVGDINLLDPKVIYGLQRYIRFICRATAGGYENEAADRKLVPLIRSGF